MKGRVLIIAGSDSGGGAGIQADIKTVTALGGYAMTAITALTAQDTNTVHAIEPVSSDFIERQISVVLSDLGADAIKTGMLHSVEVIALVARLLAERAKVIPLVVDPVMVAKGGARLLQSEAEQALVQHLLPLAHVLTPNVPEAEALVGQSIRTDDDQFAAARKLRTMGARAVLLKGGHRESEDVRDVLCWTGGDEMLTSPRIASRSTHGTGCTLASAIATGLAQGLDVGAAVRRARRYVFEAIRTAPGYGQGHGPLNHAHTVGSFT